ncbi:uncharacterized protein UTRI_05128_B [Ustilago trichophora]|uniref:BIR-domain-containing protein n=1 Tax=Ustilago trichophora TaxID=86804 RepID=A0A5C3EFJ1_9BASI|nr:uncharacterized protein UTRI_05128_B [Ustilago trichophora]
MFSEENRVASFATASSSTSTSAAKKKQSTKMTATSSSSSLSLQWPHPTTGRSAKSSGIPTPSILANHGFHHTPTPDAPDAVTHYLYPHVQLSSWQPGDDPLERLEQALPGNGWCRILRSHQQGLLDKQKGKWIWHSAELLPTSKQMTQARKETFDSEWPYDGKKGWKPTSKKLAEAGFLFTPTEEEPDNVKCIYCSKALGGWEKSDDPVHEHQRRHPECAFFNCELREPEQDEEPASAEEPAAADLADHDEAEPVVTSKKGGKRVASTTTRKASTKASKAKKSTAAIAQEEQDTPDQLDDELVAEAEPTEEPAETDTTTTTKKGSRKTRSVSTRKLAAKPVVEEQAPEPEAEEEQEEQATPALEEPAKTLSKKKSATGLGNGNAAATATRPTRAASRRATKAIGLLSADDDVDRIPRRPDKEDLEKRELALSDPIPFPTASSEDQPEPATDPVQPAKPKRSRSKTKKLDQATTPKKPTPEPEPEVPEEDAAPLLEDNTIIEHVASEAEVEEEPEEPVEEPKRRGRGASKAASSSASTKASTAGTRTRKPSAKVTAPPPPSEPEEETEQEVPAALAAEPVAFPSMSSEADEEAPRHSSSQSVSSALATVSNKPSTVAKKTSSEAAPSSDSRKTSSSSSSKRGATKSTPLASEIEITSTESEPIDEADSSILPNAGSQATIRGAPRPSSSFASSPPTAASSTVRTPLSQLPQLTTLDLDESQRAMTLGEWLQMKAEAAAQEMREAGEAQLAEFENQLRLNRGVIERRLRGRA